MTRKPQTINFWRGRLPHWEVVEGRYFVTLHLAGAIPPAGQLRIRELAAEADRLPPQDDQGRLVVQRGVFAEMEAWLDRADRAAHFAVEKVAKMVIEAIAFRENRIWRMFEYVVMPNHVHLFFEVLSGGLKNVLEGFKRWTGHQAAKLISLKDGRFWQDEWFDHWSRSDEEDERILAYIRRNPVKAGLARHFHEWPYGGWRRRATMHAPTAGRGNVTR